MKVLLYKDLKPINSGAFGEYLKIRGTKRGVKIMSNSHFKTIEAAKKSAAARSVLKELNRLKKFRKKTNLIPKAYSLVLVKEEYMGEFIYFIGYSLEHIEGKVVDECNMLGKDWDELAKARKALRKSGLMQIDSHDGNVIRVKGYRSKRIKYIFIDGGSFKTLKSTRSDCGW